MENLAAPGAMGRSVFRKRAFEEVDKDEETNTRSEEMSEELLGTIEGNQADTFVDDCEQLKEKEKEKENLAYYYFPGIDWEALRLDLNDDEDWEALQASLLQKRERERKKTHEPDRKEIARDLRMEEIEKRKAKEWKEWEAQDKVTQEEISRDYQASLWDPSEYRDDWNNIWSRSCGSFEDTTRVPAMRFTHKPAPQLGVNAYKTLQVFSAKVALMNGGLQWPLDVFGFVAIRDIIDHNRNMIFNCTRESCQTLTEEDHNLILVGPSRAVLVSGPHPMFIEVDLKVKGTTESEDRELSFLTVPLLCTLFYSGLIHHSYTSKLSTLEFTLGHLVSSVEATIFVKVIRGSWPDGFHCEFSAFVRCEFIDPNRNNAADIDREKIVLFNSRGDKGIVDNDGNIKLSRRVVTVETMGELKVSFKAWKVDCDAVEKEEVFTPSRAGISYQEMHIGFCAMEVSVAWSLISDYPVTASSVL